MSSKFNIIKDNNWESTIDISESLKPKEGEPDITFTLDHDNFGNWKLFDIIKINKKTSKIKLK